MTTANVRLKLPNFSIVKNWNSKQILAWLRKFQLDDCIPAFESRQIDGQALLELTEEKLFTFQDIKIKRRAQLAKCVNECKSQATQAKKLIGNVKVSTKKEQPAEDVQDDNDFDYWDTDFDEEEENDEDDQSFNKMNYQMDLTSTKSLPVLDNENYKSLSGSDEAFNNKPVMSEKFVDSEQYADHFQTVGTSVSSNVSLNNIPQVTSSSKTMDKPTIPKPPATKLAIKNYPRVNIPRSIPIKRPPSQPPPPPIPQPLSPKSLQEDYEVPINPLSLVQPAVVSTSTSLQSVDLNNTVNTVLRKQSNASSTSVTKIEDTNQETYEIVEPPEENYEIVNEGEWIGRGLPIHCDRTNRPAIPPRIIGSQTTSPPPLPEKPKKLQESQSICTNKDKIGTSERPLLPKKSIDESCQNGISASNSNSLLTNLLGGFRDSKRGLSGVVLSKDQDTNTEMPLTTENQSSRTSISEKNGDISPNTSPRNSTSTLDVRKATPILSRTPPQPVDDGGTNVANRPLPPVPIQSLNGFPWFHNIEREIAEEKISNLSEDGVYVVRPSKRAGQINPFTLTVSHGGKIFHLNIRHRPDGMFSLGKEKPREKAFGSVDDLINFHQKEPILLTIRGETAGKTILCSTLEK